MKIKILSIIMLSLLSFITVCAQSNTKKNNPVGTWKFEASAAPEGYTSGTTIVAQTGQKFTATMSFTGSEYKIPGENVKVEGENLSFTVYVEGQNVNVQLKMENPAKMSGKASYSEGEIPLALTRAAEKK